MPRWQSGRQPQRPGHAEPGGHAAEPHPHVELEVLAGVDHVEAGHPEHHRRPQHHRGPAKFAANRHPGRQRGQHQRRAQPKMRQHRKPLGITVAEQKHQHRQRRPKRDRVPRQEQQRAGHETQRTGDGEPNHAARASDRPVGRCRICVRGLIASSRRSARRLKAIAALRAATMHTRMPSKSSHRNATGGSARALADHAIAAANSANGNANSVWLKRISSQQMTKHE